MSASTDLVARIGENAALPANRPIDRARRITQALLLGGSGGVVVGALLNIQELKVTDMLLLVVPLLVVFMARFYAWHIMKPKPTGDPIPVVARTLATSESVHLRQVRSASSNGLLVPVVAQPVGGLEPFRSVIMIQQTDPSEPLVDPEVGTLLALQQVEPGLGELANIAQMTPEQEELMEQLRRRPRMLSNRAPSLPMRRNALERKPTSSAIEFWASTAVGFVAIVAFAWWIV
ncbi:MAG: hypothetical protein GX483_01680 [Actinomycetaceae bacterium]|nr:hypothetical protein [Actinomycetaceae bacterium]